MRPIRIKLIRRQGVARECSFRFLRGNRPQGHERSTPMATIPKIAEAIRTVLTTVAESVARPTGFVKRASKLTGPLFAQTGVFGWLKNPEASLDELCQVAAALGVEITPQGLDQRFSPEAVAFMAEVLNSAVGQVLTASSPAAIPLLNRFTAVLLQDSSIIKLPDALAEVWRGCGDSVGHHQAGLKIEARLDVLNGTLSGPLLQEARTQDKGSAIQSLPVPRGALRIADLGFFSLDTMKETDAAGAFFLSRLQVQTALFDDSSQRLNLLQLLEESGEDQVEMAVRMGCTHRLPVRLLAVRVPQEVADQRRRRMKDEARRRQQPVTKERLALANWTILVTNVPQDMLSVKEALVLARVRWQIELLFKLWKQHGKIDEWRTENPWRILCEVYAKLTAMIVQHWLLLTNSWAYPTRSMVKAARTVRDHALVLVFAMIQRTELALVIQQIGRCLAAGCRMNPRRKAPNCYQLLLGAAPQPYKSLSTSAPNRLHQLANLKEVA